MLRGRFSRYSLPIGISLSQSVTMLGEAAATAHGMQAVSRKSSWSQLGFSDKALQAPSCKDHWAEGYVLETNHR